VIRQRKIVAQKLVELGFKVFPSATNFLMLQPTEELAFAFTQYAIKEGYELEGDNLVLAGGMVFAKLLGAGILVRNFTKHPALPGAIRLSLGTEDENIKVMAALTAMCQEVKEG